MAVTPYQTRGALSFMAGLAFLSGCATFFPDRSTTVTTSPPPTPVSRFSPEGRAKLHEGEEERYAVKKWEREQEDSSLETFRRKLAKEQSGSSEGRKERRERELAARLPKTKLRAPALESNDEEAEEGGGPPKLKSESLVGNSLTAETIADSSYETMERYFEGVQRLQLGQYDRAVQAFHAFIEADRKHVYADRAQSHLAEAHLKGHEWPLAVMATRVLENEYPHSFLVPKAIYQRGLAYIGLDETEKAETTLRECVRRFPSENAAVEASRKLAELRIAKRQ